MYLLIWKKLLNQHPFALEVPIKISMFSHQFCIVFSSRSFYPFSTSSQVHNVITTFIWKECPKSQFLFVMVQLKQLIMKIKMQTFLCTPQLINKTIHANHEPINLGKIVRLTPKCFSLKKRKRFFISFVLKFTICSYSHEVFNLFTSRSSYVLIMFPIHSQQVP
jgi:hypothetical protein